MKKKLVAMIAVPSLLALLATVMIRTKVKTEQLEQPSFLATVERVSGFSVLVTPLDEKMCSSIQFSAQNLESIHVKKGDIVRITYTGHVMESYPAQINATGWCLVTDINKVRYTGLWLDEKTAKLETVHATLSLIVSEIHDDYFIANGLDENERFRIKGSISGEWCEGDYVRCDVRNLFRDASGNAEAKLISIEIDEGMMDYKPVIYLYPQTTMEVSVKLDYKGSLTCTYPAYRDGWKVTAQPDGTLTDERGQKYNYLYWEGQPSVRYDLSKGFCIRGEDTCAFLEAALEKLGLNRREANEFIVYWLPQMQNNPYNIISFQSDLYTESAQLEINPAPDTLIRVFMAWRASDSYVMLEEQALDAPTREGFTVVEWGGSEIT